MNRKVIGTIITLLFGTAAFLSSRLLWPLDPSMPGPGPALLPHYIIVSAIEALAFGLGLAFLILGWKSVQQASHKAMALWMYLSLGWLLVSWWPHDNLHMQIGMDFSRLIYLEYGFHVTLIIASLIVANGFLAMLRGKA